VPDPDRRSALSNKVAVITGAAHGLGREPARTLSEHEASVALIDIAGDAVFALAAELPDALAIRTDVTDGAQVTDMVSGVVARFGAIDIVVNNAGGARGYTDAGSAEQEWRATLELNLTSAWLVTQAVALHEETWRGPSCQHHVEHGVAPTGGCLGFLHRGKRWRDRSDAGIGQGTRALEHHGQRDRARVHAARRPPTKAVSGEAGRDDRGDHRRTVSPPPRLCD
jgi:hypothetical protein